MKSSDDRLPFTCIITGEDCGSMINHIYISVVDGQELLENKVVSMLPVSDTIFKKLTRRNINKLTKSLKKELKEIHDKE